MMDSKKERMKRIFPFRDHDASSERHEATDSKTFPEATALASTNAMPQLSSAHLKEYFPDGKTLGMRVLHNPAGAQVDIIFIHGLMGDAYNTWMDDTKNVYWPVELLGKANNDSRIIAFGYDSQVMGLFSSVGQNTLRGHADSFLGQLASLTSDSSRRSKRKIILVVHSLGGLVAKKALCLSAHSPHKHLRQLHERIHGILFLGTPHRGSDLAPNAKRLAKLFKCFGGGTVNPGILEPLLRDSSILEEAENDFGLWLRGKTNFENITCFYEEFEVPSVGFIVSKESATISGFPGPYSIHANHMKMVKFGSPEDPGFKLVHGELRRWLDAIEEEVKPAMKEKDMLCMLRSLAFPEMDSRSHHVRDTTPGTCLWVFDSPIYDKFLNNGGLLCIKGKPGSGKSTMLQEIITKFQDDSKATGDVVTSFFFWGSGTELLRSRLGMYRSLLHQLCQTMPQLYSNMTREFLDKISKRGPVGEAWNWNERQLSDTLMDHLGRRPLSRSTWIFLDALDEAGEKDAKIVAEFLKDLSSAAMRFFKPGGARLGICFTCRHYPIIRIGTDLQICVEDRNGPDISTHSQEMLLKWGFKSEEMEHLRTFITEKANGVFLWAQLVLDQVEEYHLTKTFRQIQRIIQETPPELKQMYREKLQIIGDQDRAHSRLMFQWICFAQEPLSLNNLRIALLLDSNRSKRTLQQCFAADDYISQDALLINVVLDRTRGLAQISHGTVQLIHQSVRDFLENDSHELYIGSGTSNQLLFGSCLRFMSFPEYSVRDERLNVTEEPLDSSSDESSDEQSRLRKRALRVQQRERRLQERASEEFAIYATKYWHRHAAAAARGSQLENNTIHELDLLSNYKIGRRWSECCQCFSIWISFQQNDPLADFMLFGGSDTLSLLHALAAYGRLNVLKLAIGKRGLPIDPQKAGAPTLLHCAVACRQEQVTSWLLSLKTVDPNKQDFRGEVPLHWLVRPNKLGSNPHPEKAVAILEMFLQTPKVDLLVESDAGSVLHQAVFHGRYDLLRIMLKKTKINISLYDKHDWTLLDLALLKDDEQALEVLITAGFEKLQNGTAKTDTERNTEIIGHYLRKDLLNTASTYGMKADSRVVLTSKNDTKTRFKVSRVENTTLHLAARMGNKVLCQFLIDLRFNVGVMDKFRREPLHRAAESGHPSIVRLLLDSGANAHSQDVYGLSPAHLAIIHGHFDIARTLAQELEKSDARCMTKFFRAILHSNESLAYRACLDDADYYQKSFVSVKPTLLQQAVMCSDFKMVQAVATPSSIEAACEGVDGKEILHWAVERGDLEVVEVLLDHGAPVNNTDTEKGRTPLHVSAKKGHQEIVTLLVQRGADAVINQTDRRLGWTPLHSAVYGSHGDVVRELVNHGADVSVKDKRGKTPREVAIGEHEHLVCAWLGLEEETKT